MLGSLPLGALYTYPRVQREEQEVGDKDEQAKELTGGGTRGLMTVANDLYRWVVKPI